MKETDNTRPNILKFYHSGKNLENQKIKYIYIEISPHRLDLVTKRNDHIPTYHQIICACVGFFSTAKISSLTFMIKLQSEFLTYSKLHAFPSFAQGNLSIIVKSGTCYYNSKAFLYLDQAARCYESLISIKDLRSIRSSKESKL